MSILGHFQEAEPSPRPSWRPLAGQRPHPPRPAAGGPGPGHRPPASSWTCPTPWWPTWGPPRAYLLRGEEFTLPHRGPFLGGGKGAPGPSYPGGGPDPPRWRNVITNALGSFPRPGWTFWGLNFRESKLTDPIVYIANNYFSKYNEIFRFILTHPDMDHMSGIKELFNRKYVRNFWDTNNDKYIDPGYLGRFSL